MVSFGYLSTYQWTMTMILAKQDRIGQCFRLPQICFQRNVGIGVCDQGLVWSGLVWFGLNRACRDYLVLLLDEIPFRGSCNGILILRRLLPVRHKAEAGKRVRRRTPFTSDDARRRQRSLLRPLKFPESGVLSGIRSD